MSGDQNAPRRTVSYDPLEYEVYEQSQANIRRLKDTLPHDLVISLAREVIQRVASRDKTVDSISSSPSPAELEALCRALISSDQTAAAEIIVQVRAAGTGAEDIYLKYLAAAARRLGDWWEEDRVDFNQVTIGTARMIAIMRSMKHLFETSPPLQEKSAIFASVPGENHTLGVRMAAELFRKDGWDISLKLGLDHDELIAQIEQDPRGIVGLSISGKHSVEALSRLVVAIHICCPNALLLVSGQDIESTRDILNMMGVDGIAGTIEEAKDQMFALWERKVGSKALQ